MGIYRLKFENFQNMFDTFKNLITKSTKLFRAAHGILKFPIEFSKNQRKYNIDFRGEDEGREGLETSPMSCDKWA